MRLLLFVCCFGAVFALMVAGQPQPPRRFTLDDLFHTPSDDAVAARSGAETFFRATYQRQLLVGRSATGLLPSKQLQSIARTLSQVDAICEAVDRAIGFSQNVLKVCLCVCVCVYMFVLCVCMCMCICACACVCVCVCACVCAF